MTPRSKGSQSPFYAWEEVIACLFTGIAGAYPQKHGGVSRSMTLATEGKDVPARVITLNPWSFGRGTDVRQTMPLLEWPFRDFSGPTDDVGG